MSLKLSPAVRLAATLTRTAESAFLVGGWDPGMKGDGGNILDDVWELKWDADTQLTWHRVELQVESFKSRAVPSCSAISHKYRHISWEICLRCTEKHYDMATPPACLYQKHRKIGLVHNSCPGNRK